jgi:hypothetical protein
MTHPQDEAFGAALSELAKEKGIKGAYMEEAIRLARHGFRSSAWNDAISAGVPVSDLITLRTLIYD